MGDMGCLRQCPPLHAPLKSPLKSLSETSKLIRKGSGHTWPSSILMLAPLLAFSPIGLLCHPIQ